MITRLLKPFTDVAYTMLRVITGLLFAFHGIQKLFGVFLPPDVQIPVWSQAWIGGVIELVTGLAMAAGLFTPWMAFLASGTMAVAYVQMPFTFVWK